MHFYDCVQQIFFYTDVTEERELLLSQIIFFLGYILKEICGKKSSNGNFRSKSNQMPIKFYMRSDFVIRINFLIGLSDNMAL